MNNNYTSNQSILDSKLEAKKEERRLNSELGKKKKRNKIIVNTLIIIIGVAAWIAIVFYGMDIAKKYVDKAMADAVTDIKAESYENYIILEGQNKVFEEEINKLNTELFNLKNSITTLNDEIVLFSIEVSSLESSISAIDNVIISSVQTQKDIGLRILELDNKLKDLRKSLNTLMEAPNE